MDTPKGSAEVHWNCSVPDMQLLEAILAGGTEGASFGRRSDSSLCKFRVYNLQQIVREFLSYMALRYP